MRNNFRPWRPFLHVESLEDRLTPTATAPEAWLASLSPQTIHDLRIVQLPADEANGVAFANEWIVRVAGLSGDRAAQLASMRSLVSPWNSAMSVDRQLGQDGLFLVSTGSIVNRQQLTDWFESIAGFQYIEPNLVIHSTAVPNDVYYPSQWALHNTGQTGGAVDADIDAPEAWQLTDGSSGVVVGVIDSGVDYTHPDLAANMWVNPGEVAGDGLDNDGNGYVDDVHGWDFANNDNDPMDDNGHGTSVAGIISAATNNSVGVAGINWGAKIMALKYAKSDFVASTADVIEAVNYATMMRRDYGVNIRATNNSYGIFGNSQALSDAIQAGGDAGIMFITSAGNSNTDNDVGPQYPANYPLEAVMSVAATTHTDAKASFSSFGATTVHLGAPGVNVLTTDLGGSYSGFGGTSAASPMVAGVVALLWDAAPYASLAEIRSALLAGTDPIPALAGITVTGGRLNAHRSLLQLGLRVTDVTPDAGVSVATPPTHFTVQFSDDVDPTSIQADDLSVNGIFADHVVVVDARTFEFHFDASPVTNEGRQDLQIAAGVATRASDADGTAPLTTSFQWDAVPLVVSSAIPGNGEIATLGFTSVVIQFNEPIDPTSASPSDLVLDRGRVIGVLATAADELTFSISGIDDEGPWNYLLPEGAIRDTFGNGNTAFAASIDIDMDSKTLVFERVEPLGSLIFFSLGNVGGLYSPVDVDDFVVSAIAGETLTAVLRQTSASATMSVEIVGTGAVYTSSSPGAPVLVPITTLAGTTSLRVTGDAATSYTIDVYRNVLLEESDSSASSPLAIDDSRIPVGSGRFAVLGTSDLGGFSWNMDQHPGWSFDTGWAWGQPAGVGGDPAAGYTGSNVVGYNLNGAYTDNIRTTRYATLGPIDLTGASGVNLSFRRWLGIESSIFDRASIEISQDGFTWTPIWTHSGSSVVESAWSLQTYDISSIADNQPAIYIRWGLGPTDSSVTYSGWNIDDVVIAGAGATPLPSDEDAYTVDLSSSVGRTVDISLAGLAGADFSQSQMTLIGPDGVTVVANATSTPGGVDASNSDLIMQDVPISQPGVYRILILAGTSGSYSVVVSDGIALETEPNDFLASPPRNLDASGAALGFIGIPPLGGGYTLSLDAASMMTLAASLSIPGVIELPIVEQSAGSLDANLSGSIDVTVEDGTIQIHSANIDFLPNIGSFQPGFASADLAGEVNLFGFIFHAALRNLEFTLNSDVLSVQPDGTFDATQVVIEFTEGQIAYSASGAGGTLPMNTPDTGNDVTLPGRIEILPDQLRLTIPLRLTFTASVPLGFEADLDFQSTITAVVLLPVLDEDHYSIALGAGESASVELEALPHYSVSNAPLFAPTFTILAPNGSFVATGGPGGTTNFVATEAGLYRIVVSTSSGQGEYRLAVDDVDSPPSVHVAGPTSVVRGHSATYTFSASDLEPANQSGSWIYDVDWDGDGAFDQQLFGSDTITATHVFPNMGSSNVTVRATAADGSISAPDSIMVDVYQFLVQPDPLNPAVTHLLIGGSPGDDAYYFFLNNLFTIQENGILSFSRITLPSFNGKMILHAQGGNDVIAADLTTTPNEIFGGDGNDLIDGGSLSDLIDGGLGDDFLRGDSYGGNGNDTLLGGEGNDILIGQFGSDQLRGGLGSDLIVAGGLFFDNSYSIDQSFALRREWTSNRSYDERIANILGVGSGPRANGNVVIIPGATSARDDAVDEVFGDEDQDWLIAGDEDVLDRETLETLTPIE